LLHWHRYRDGESVFQQDYRGKHQLVATDRMKFCLDASPKRKVTSKEFKRGTFSPCRWDSNQVCHIPYFMWCDCCNMSSRYRKLFWGSTSLRAYYYFYPIWVSYALANLYVIDSNENWCIGSSADLGTALQWDIGK